MLIVITGTPGTGKTEVSKALGKIIGARVIRLSEFANEKKLASGFNKKMGCSLVDAEKLRKALLSELKKANAGNIVVEGHLACEMRIPADFVFVLRCNPKILGRRMEMRDYPEEKINGNMMAEMLDYCTQLSNSNYGAEKVFELETSKSDASEVAQKIKRIASGKKVADKPISYRNELMEFIGISKGRKQKWTTKKG